MIGAIAVLDACVLYPAPLRDFMMRLAVSRLYQPRWSAQIHEEWVRNLLENRTDLTREQLERTCGFMDAAMPEASVSGYKALIDTITLPDPDDRHVLAAAIEGKANILVTLNSRDFPPSLLSPYQIVPMHPEAFVCALYQERPRGMLSIIAKHRAMLHKPPQTAEEYIETLRRNQLVQIADILDKQTDKI